MAFRIFEPRSPSGRGHVAPLRARAERDGDGWQVRVPVWRETVTVDKETVVTDEVLVTIEEREEPERFVTALRHEDLVVEANGKVTRIEPASVTRRTRDGRP